ncbi:MAG: HD domain-containing protein [Salinibacterium sp.]|nr:HD domain-containing protein [Salinibacterium sp.]
MTMDPALVHQLVRAIEQKDLSTAAHTWRVVLYTRAMMEAAGFDHDSIHAGTYAAALHDVGKLDLPTAILQKPGKLTEEEFEAIKLHPVAGYARMVSHDIEDQPVLDLIRFHHERWDGLGYPYGLAGDDIPIGARYFAVIDTFDALTSVRPYREKIGERAAEEAIAILEDGSGTRYWVEAVDAFKSLYREGMLDFILHYFNDDVPVPEFHHQRIEQEERLRRRSG